MTTTTTTTAATVTTTQRQQTNRSKAPSLLKSLSLSRVRRWGVRGCLRRGARLVTRPSLPRLFSPFHSAPRAFRTRALPSTSALERTTISASNVRARNTGTRCLCMSVTREPHGRLSSSWCEYRSSTSSRDCVRVNLATLITFVAMLSVPVCASLTDTYLLAGTGEVVSMWREGGGGRYPLRICTRTCGRDTLEEDMSSSLSRALSHRSGKIDNGWRRERKREYPGRT